MKTLYLVRHAKSSWKDPALDDFDRPLNKRGKHDAPLMARKLYEMGIKPDIVLSSPAKRALKTAKIFAKTLNVPLQRDKRLYEAMPSDFREVMQEAFKMYEHVMLVSHNPGLTMFNNEISDIPIYNIPTAGIVGVGFETLDTAFTDGKQLFYIYPKKFQ